VHPDSEIDLDVLREPPPGLAGRIEHALEWLDEFRSRPEIAAFGVVFAIGLIAIFVFASRRPDPVDVAQLVPEIRLETTAPLLIQPSSPLVHVNGAVMSPGVYSLAPGSRVIDAIEAAGGAAPDGLLHELNLAAPVVDGMQIRVPIEGEAVTLMTPGEEGAPMDPNFATAQDLERLNGIGPSLAAAIVSYRDAHGAFAMAEDLLAVPGIGPAKLETLRDQIALR
jgi:competence protein ComEA